MRWLCTAVLVSVSAHAAEEGAPLLLTSGWQAVVEIPELRAVAIDDPHVARVSEAHDGLVTLLGVVPGQTHLWAFTGRPEAPHVVDYRVVVTHFPTLLPFEEVLSLQVDQRRTLKLAGVSRLEVADRSVCDVTAGPDAVELTARRAGTTTLIAWVGLKFRYVLITVRGGGVMPTADELDEELTEPVDGRVVLRVGERGVFDAPDGLWRFAMKDDRVAAMKPREGRVVFEGLHVGATRVLFWSSAGVRSSRFVVVLPRALGDQDPVPPPPDDATPQDDGTKPQTPPELTL